MFLAHDEQVRPSDDPRQYFRFDLVRSARADTFLFSRELCHYLDWYTYWQVIDVVQIGRVPNTQVIFYEACELNGIFDPEIIAIVDAVRPIPTHMSNVNPLGASAFVVDAWRVSTELARIIEIPPQGIVCSISGEGLPYPWYEP
jgi:hypothetical protein